ncbi:hypothetical protein B0H11DRAFT_187071 [Mycena galericulata]|nr:hypothetical protein B0H11DRAFT_187071 [Mycena galericulata]
MLTNCNANLRAQLAELDSAISEHRLRIQELEDIRKPIQQELNRVVYPVLTLPPEITSDIFCQCLPLREWNSTYSFDTHEAPLLLLQVCATWRSIAISTPRLWAHLHLYIRKPPIRKGIEAVVEEWLSRAGSSPLSFSLNELEDGFGPDIVGTLVRRHASHFQSVAFRLTKHHFIKLEGAGPFSLLEELDISLPYHGGGPGPVLRPTIFADAPRLRQLTLRGSASPSGFHLPYLHLSKFTCFALTTDELFDLMRDAPLLEDCTCAVIPHNETVTIRTQVVTHERLQTLHFRDSSTEVLRLLCLPALENLHFTYVDTGSDGDYLPFLAACSASLRKFYVETSCDLGVEWFSSLPGLTDVMVYNPSKEFSSAFLSKLDRAQDNGFLLHLQSLAFENCATDVDSSMVQALTSRCSSPHDEANLQLRTFRLLWPDNKTSLRLDDFTIAELRRLVDQGMNIYVGPRRKNLIYIHNSSAY